MKCSYFMYKTDLTNNHFILAFKLCYMRIKDLNLCTLGLLARLKLRGLTVKWYAIVTHIKVKYACCC
jgi:hypothetical protein